MESLLIELQREGPAIKRQIVEFRFHGDIFREIFETVQVDHVFKTRTPIVTSRFYAETVRTNAVGYAIPAKLKRVMTATKEQVILDGFVTIPYSAVHSVVEYEVESDDASKRIGFFNE